MATDNTPIHVLAPQIWLVRATMETPPIKRHPTNTEMLMGTCECQGCSHCASVFVCEGTATEGSKFCAGCADRQTFPACSKCPTKIDDHVSIERGMCKPCEDRILARHEWKKIEPVFNVPRFIE